jgi:hypothetical protein
VKLNWMHVVLLVAGAVAAAAGALITADPPNATLYKSIAGAALTVSTLFGGLSPSVKT